MLSNVEFSIHQAKLTRYALYIKSLSYLKNLFSRSSRDVCNPGTGPIGIEFFREVLSCLRFLSCQPTIPPAPLAATFSNCATLISSCALRCATFYLSPLSFSLSPPSPLSFLASGIFSISTIRIERRERIDANGWGGERGEAIRNMTRGNERCFFSNDNDETILLSDFKNSTELFWKRSEKKVFHPPLSSSSVLWYFSHSPRRVCIHRDCRRLPRIFLSYRIQPKRILFAGQSGWCSQTR